MGGKVFTKLGLAQPRISQELYERMIAECLPKLEEFFDNVVVPRDAPDKLDHGDIDFLVGGIFGLLRDEDLWKRIEGALAAEYRIARGNSQSYAVPHPDIENAYIQVDVELAPGDGTLAAADLFEWTRFMKGDADLLQIIGIAHRPLGLVCNDRGFHVRIEEIEPYNKKMALIFLTRDLVQAMEFYGFDVDKYHKGFESETEIFDWVARGRFFSPEVFEQHTEKADDRSRKRKRPMFRRFVDEYMPEQPKGGNKVWTRWEVLLEALRKFDVQDEYFHKISTHKHKEAEEALWEEIKDVLPLEGNPLKSTVETLRRWVIFENSRPVISNKPMPADYPGWSQFIDEGNKADVLAWVTQEWQEVERHAQAYNQQKGHTPWRLCSAYE